MTYVEEVQARVGKVTEEIATAWLDLRMEVGEDDDVETWLKPAERRAELIEQAADIINQIEGIDAEAKRKADKKAADEKAMQDRINQTIFAMAKTTETPAYLLYGGRQMAWLDELHGWSPQLHSGDFNWMHRL